MRDIARVRPATTRLIKCAVHGTVPLRRVLCEVIRAAFCTAVGTDVGYAARRGSWSSSCPISEAAFGGLSKCRYASSRSAAKSDLEFGSEANEKLKELPPARTNARV
eukprot:762794-Rhodomonas_salina.2